MSGLLGVLGFGRTMPVPVSAPASQPAPVSASVAGDDCRRVRALGTAIKVAGSLGSIGWILYRCHQVTGLQDRVTTLERHPTLTAAEITAHAVLINALRESVKTLTVKQSDTEEALGKVRSDGEAVNTALVRFKEDYSSDRDSIIKSLEALQKCEEATTVELRTFALRHEQAALEGRMKAMEIQAQAFVLKTELESAVNKLENLIATKKPIH